VEISFYHLEQRPLEQVLPILLEKTLERGWKAIIEVSDEKKAKIIDDAIWSFNQDSFIAHAIAGNDNDAEQPILITTKTDNPNAANIRFFVSGAIPQTAPKYDKEYKRLVFIFDGHDPKAVEEARTVWKNLKEGNELTYWQQNPSGAWEKKA
jgi:DNA polymerase-3 subunit chi